jgi:hypothetical protein
MESATSKPFRSIFAPLAVLVKILRILLFARHLVEA